MLFNPDSQKIGFAVRLNKLTQLIEVKPLDNKQASGVGVYKDLVCRRCPLSHASFLLNGDTISCYAPTIARNPSDLSCLPL